MKIYYKIIALFIGIILAIAVIFLYNNDKEFVENSVCYKSSCFQVEIADNALLRQQGLMFREHLDENKGMLFIFEENGIYPFWMKNTLIPLDIIWLDSNGNVVYIEKNVQPCKEEMCKPYNPKKMARYVLEINANISNELGLKIGDRLLINLR